MTTITTERLKQEISIRELSRRSGVSHTCIRKIEKGIIKNPSIEILNKIADALNIPRRKLWTDIGYIECKPKRCQNCKSTKLVIEYDKLFQVICPNCNAKSSKTKSVLDAIENWNN